MSRVYYITVSEDEDGQRLDRFLQKHLKGTPIGLLQKLMRKGQIRVDSKRVKTNTRIVAGQAVRIPPLENKYENQKNKITEKDAEFIRSLVIYDKDGIVAINKPSGIATQGGTNINRHIDGLLPALTDDKGVVPRLVHRLDKDTSGVLLLARSSAMAKEMGKVFQGRSIRKIYWALTVPAPDLNQGEICAPLKKVGGPGNEKMAVVDDDDSQFALTLFDVIDRAHKQLAFVAFWPRTGRTHQIRVHANHMGCPILGDGKYGGHDAMLDGVDHVQRVHLHARSIEFKNPKTQKPVFITAPLAGDIKTSWKDLGFDPNSREEVFSDIKDI